MGLIKTNVNDFLEKIETEDIMKEALSVEELYKLAETPCKKAYSENRHRCFPV